jgi:alpha-D-ribose 1-methylphosphonate 5-triphosphate diphosphatase
LVLPDNVIDDGAVLLEDDRIVEVCPERAAGAAEVDLGGATLMPGLVDLHSDAVEIEAEPRAGVYFPHAFAVAQIDRRGAAAGITTFLHAVSFASNEFGLRASEQAAVLVRSIVAAGPSLLVDNRVHARYEVTDELAPEVLEPLVEEGTVSLLSFMDHTPGQGQYLNDQAYRDYMVSHYKVTDAEVDGQLELKTRQQANVPQRLERMAATCRRHGVPLASHDDDCPDRVRHVHSLGATISEFPTTLAAATVLPDVGLHGVVGSPNVFRGGSQGTGLRAAELIAAGYVDCLASDYVPATLLPAVFKLERELGLPLPTATALASANPAAAVKLTDRGRIAPSLRADLIAVRHIAGQPQVVRTWSAGRLVFSTEYGNGRMLQRPQT